MANIFPTAPHVNVLETDPITNLCVVGETDQALPVVPDVFAKGCIITRTDNGVDYFNSGTVTTPVWTVVTTGSAMTSLTGDVVAAGPGAASAVVEGIQTAAVDSVVPTINGEVLIWDNDAEKYVVKAISGDATLAKTGAITLAGSVKVYTTQVNLTSTQIKNLNTTPVQMIAAPGSGKYIEILKVSGELTFATAAYATHTELDLVFHGQTAGPLKNTTLLPISSGILNDIFVTGSQSQNLENTAVDMYATGGNPATGSGTAKIFLTYKIVTIA